MTATASGRSGAATAAGKDGKARGSIGSAIFLVERAGDWTILHARAVIIGQEVDGITTEPDVFYTLRGGRVVTA